MNILFSFSEKGAGDYNEDVYDIENNYFWIIDGATDLFNANILERNRDVYDTVWIISNEIKNKKNMYRNKSSDDLTVLLMEV